MIRNNIIKTRIVILVILLFAGQIIIRAQKLTCEQNDKLLKAGRG